ncbi:MAG: hypothetical protein CSA68_00425 [Rhodobacterales bacterium]|nr:MAG: hypothetical protein CSA68_00425 [Rhodobacterales bacterium]
MKELSLSMLIAVFEDMFGKWLWWGLVLVAVAITVLFLIIIIKERHFSPKHFVVAQIFAPFGALAAVLFVQWITNSGFSDIGGPIDVIVLLGIAGLGAVGTSIWVYVINYFLKGRKA